MDSQDAILVFRGDLVRFTAIIRLRRFAISSNFKAAMSMPVDLSADNFPSLVDLGQPSDRISTWALLRILEGVRQGVEGLAGLVAIRFGDEEILSSEFLQCATKVDEIQRRHATGEGEAISAYLIAYEGRWLQEHGGLRRAVFLECKSQRSAEPMRARVDLRMDDSGKWLIDDKVHPFHPAAWSAQGALDFQEEAAECERLMKEHARVRQQIEEVKADSKHYKRVDNRNTGHPKFGRWHENIQRIGERISALKKKIEFVEDQIRRGETPSSYDLVFPEGRIRPPRDPEPEPEEKMADLKARLSGIAEQLLYMCWRHLWCSGDLSQRLKAMAAVHAELLVFQEYPASIHAANSASELNSIEHGLKLLQAGEQPRRSWRLRSKLDQDNATLKYMRFNLNRGKEFAEFLANEPLHDEEYVADIVAGLENRIKDLEREEVKLKQRLIDLEKTKVDDPPMKWVNALDDWEFDPREELPIPDLKDLTPEERGRKQVIENDVRQWWEERYPEIVANRLREKQLFETSEPWVVIFTSDLTGLLAAQDAMVPKFPRGHRYMLCEEYRQWIADHPDEDHVWHIHVSLVFESTLPPDLLDKARAGFPDVPPSEYRIQRISEQWRRGRISEACRLWRWDGVGMRLLARNFGE